MFDLWPPGRETPPTLPGDPPPPGQSPENFVFVYVPFPSKKNAACLLTEGSFLLIVELLYLQLTILAFLLTIGAFSLTILPFLLTIGAFLLTLGKCV